MGLENPLHLAILFVIILVLFGARRLPELGRSLGEGMRGFKESLSGDSAESKTPLAPGQAPAPAPPATSSAPEPVAAPAAPAPAGAPEQSAPAADPAAEPAGGTPEPH